MNAVEKLLVTASAEIGYLEKKSNAQLDSMTANAGSNNYTKYARDLDKLGVYNGPKNGYAWCAVFAMWCMVQTFGLEQALAMTGQKKGGLGASCTYLVGYYKQMGRFYTSSPQPGDQIFFSSDAGKTFTHTGLVEKVDGGCVYTIEGNTSGASGVVANGGGVCRKSYVLSYSKIGGYGRPKYELAQTQQTQQTQSPTQQTQQTQSPTQPTNTPTDAPTAQKPGVSVENVLALIADHSPVYRTVEDVPSWYRDAILKLIDRGALNGTGETGGINVSADFCRVMTVLDRIGKLD